MSVGESIKHFIHDKWEGKQVMSAITSYELLFGDLVLFCCDVHFIAYKCEQIRFHCIKIFKSLIDFSVKNMNIKGFILCNF